jgi:hypothetical protein
MYYTIIDPVFLQYLKYRKFDRLLIHYVEIHIDDPQ